MTEHASTAGADAKSWDESRYIEQNVTELSDVFARRDDVGDWTLSWQRDNWVDPVEVRFATEQDALEYAAKVAARRDANPLTAHEVRHLDGPPVEVDPLAIARAALELKRSPR